MHLLLYPPPENEAKRVKGCELNFCSLQTLQVCFDNFTFYNIAFDKCLVNFANQYLKLTFMGKNGHQQVKYQSQVIGWDVTPHLGSIHLNISPPSQIRH